MKNCFAQDMPKGFNSDVISCCEISKKLTFWTEKIPNAKELLISHWREIQISNYLLIDQLLNK